MSRRVWQCHNQGRGVDNGQPAARSPPLRRVAPTFWELSCRLVGLAALGKDACSAPWGYHVIPILSNPVLAILHHSLLGRVDDD